MIRYLRQIPSGHMYVYTKELAGRSDMEECAMEKIEPPRHETVEPEPPKRKYTRKPKS